MFEQPTLKKMSVNDLVLSKNNPRFPKPVRSEEEAILTFFKLKKVGPEKIEAIIKDIVNTGGVLEDFIVLKEDGKYIVYDGNRRLVALKLLSYDTSKIIKEKYPKTYKYLEETKNRINISNLQLNVKIYTDARSMANHVVKIHSGEQSGVGQITWDFIEKDTFSAQFFDKPLKFGNLVYKKLEESADRKKLYSQIKNKNYATTFERIFGYSNIRKRIFNLNRGMKIDLNNKNQLNKVCEMLELFILLDGSVSDVYTAEKAEQFFKNISPINSQDNILDFENSILVENNKDSKDKEESDETDLQKSTSVNKKIDNPKKYNNQIELIEQNKLVLNLKASKKTIERYEDYNLIELVDTATDTNGENLINNVLFYSENQYVKDNVFSGMAPIGNYNIQAKLIKNDLITSRRIDIEVVVSKKNIKISQPQNEFFKSIASFADGEIKIKINNSVDLLIKEIQSLKTPQNYKLMIASSVRQLVELSIDKVINEKSLKDHGNSKQNLEFLVNHLSEKTLLKEICQGENKLKFFPIKNLLGSTDTNALVEYLNLITHDSHHAVYEDLLENVNKKITPLLIVFHNFLQLK